MTVAVITRTCRHCGRTIEKVAGRFGTFWYDALSGDEGGVYDHCDASPTESHQPGTPSWMRGR